MIKKLLSNPAFFYYEQKMTNDYRSVRNEFSSYLGDADVSILDLGCSTGIGGRVIFDLKNSRYVGIDIEPGYVAFAKKKNPGVDYRVMDGRALDFPDQFFDRVFLLGVLHHMNDATARDCLKEVRRVLNPSGYLLIAEPVFTPGRLWSNVFLSLDRGRYIRESAQYLSLISEFDIVRQRFFYYSLHCLFSIVARSSTC